MKITKIERIAWNILRLFVESKKAKATVDISDPETHADYNVGDDFDSLAHADDESESKVTKQVAEAPAKTPAKKTARKTAAKKTAKKAA